MSELPDDRMSWKDLFWTALALPIALYLSYWIFSTVMGLITKAMAFVFRLLFG